MTIRKRLVSALGANLTTQVVTALIQIASLPVFLRFWSLEQYGEWLILAAIPTYFALADLGFLAVIINKMTIISATGNTHRVNVLFQSALMLWICVLASACILAGCFVLLLEVRPFESIDNKFALVLLTTGAALSMSSALVDAIFRSQGEFAFGTQLGNGARVIEWVGLLAGLAIGNTFLSAATGQFGGCVLSFLLKWQISRRRHPHIQWKISTAGCKEVRELFKPAMAFMAFPVSNAISIQGMTLIVGHLFSPTLLAVFNTYRTIARIQVQAITLIGRSMWPEISRQFGMGSFNVVNTLTKQGTLASVSMAIATCIFLSLFGNDLLQLWTNGQIPYQREFFNALLIPTFLTATWQMAMVTLNATNNHLGLSSSYLFASVASLGFTVVLSDWLGAQAITLGLIGFETILMAACLIHFRSFTKRYR